MNAHALLTAQGWRGTGHSLHKTDDSIGLQKPITISKKVGNKGIGKVQHFTSDQWWLNAFDEQLKGLDTNKDGKLVQNVTSGKLNTFEKGAAAKYSIYSTFVRGGFLEGTLSPADDTESPDLTDTTSSDDKSKDANAADAKSRKETKEERRARKEAKRQRKEDRARRRAAKLERKAASGRSSAAETTYKDEEKQRRRAKKEEKRRKRKLEEEKEKARRKD